MPVTDATVFTIYDTSAAGWKQITALQLKNDVAAPEDWLIVYDGTADNQWEKIDPTGFKALTAATDYAITLDTKEKVPGTLLETYFGGGGPVIPPNTFSMEITTATASYDLLTGGSCTVDIDWGDGVVETGVVFGGAINHIYPSAGNYVISFSNRVGDFGLSYDRTATKSVVRLGGMGEGWTWGDVRYGFRQETTLIAVDEPAAFQQRSQSLFNGCSSLADVPDLITLSTGGETVDTLLKDTAITKFPAFNVDEMDANVSIAVMFQGCSSANTFAPGFKLFSSGSHSYNSLFRGTGIVSAENLDFSYANNIVNLFWQATDLVAVPATMNMPLISSLLGSFRNTGLTAAPTLILTAGSITTCNSMFRDSPLVTFPAWDGAAFTNCTNWGTAWSNCNLDMPSVENALKLCVDSGQTNQTTTISGVPFGSWSAQALADYDTLTNPTTGRGWTITTS